MHPRKEQALCGPGWSVVHSVLCGCQPLCRCKSVQTAGLEGLGCCVCVCLMECAGAACGLHLPVRWNATVVSHMLESPPLPRITSGTHCNTQQEHHHHTTTLCELTAHRVFRVWIVMLRGHPVRTSKSVLVRHPVSQSRSWWVCF